MEHQKHVCLDISMGISKMRWSGSWRCKVNDCVVYYAGEDSSLHQNGIAIIVLPETTKAVNNVVQLSDKVIMVQIETTTITTSLIQLYAPTANCKEATIN